MSKKGVQAIIDSVHDALENECWIPALATALTLPDIMGQVEFPGLIDRRGKRLTGEQYKRWFTEHVLHHFADENGWDKEGNPINPYFSADMCYKLRCSILHQGANDIEYEFNFAKEKGTDYRYEFQLRVNACNSYGVMWVEPCGANKVLKTVRVCIDIKTLCNAICEEALSFLKSSSDDFNNVGIEVIDVSRIVNFGHKK